MRRYGALSLDLWDTVLFDQPENQSRRANAQILALSRTIMTRGGTSIDPGWIASARDSIWSRWDAAGVNRASVPVAQFLEEIRASLDGRFAVPLQQVVDRYSVAGLAEFPPEVNPEARTVVASLEGRGIPTIIVSNTTRSGRTWRAFLHDAESMPVVDVIGSCDVGAVKPEARIFQVACLSLTKAPPEVLHVGDLLASDVRGALSAGMGAALYTGLWSKYVEPEPGMKELPPEGSGIPVFESLLEVLPLMSVGD